MKAKCERSDCEIARGLPCEMGVINFRDCKHYAKEKDIHASAKAEPEAVDEGSGFRVPWTGRAFGLADMSLVSARSAARLVALIGPYNAGKTSLLTAIFAHFSQLGFVKDYGFTGSFTLEAWNQLKGHTKWPSQNNGVFPPHTHDTGQRTPGLLHLAFRRGNGIVRDLLFTDAPGEWFTRWVTNESASNAEGARWIAENATHFIFVVDRTGLAGPDVGLIRVSTLALARKLSENRRGRPVIAVWTKSDDPIDEEVEKVVRTRLEELFGEHPSLNLHVKDPACVNLLEILLQDTLPSPVNASSSSPSSAFLAYGGSPA